jgi:hypothetical protein
MARTIVALKRMGTSRMRGSPLLLALAAGAGYGIAVGWFLVYFTRGFEQKPLDFGTAGEWFGGLATTAAVVVALVAADSERRRRVRAEKDRVAVIVAGMASELSFAAQTLEVLKRQLDKAVVSTDVEVRMVLSLLVTATELKQTRRARENVFDLPHPVGRDLIAMLNAVDAGQKSAEMLLGMKIALEPDNSLFTVTVNNLVSEVVPVAKAVWRLRYSEELNMKAIADVAEVAMASFFAMAKASRDPKPG